MSGKRKILLMSPNLNGIKGGINRIQPSLGIGYLAAVLEAEGMKAYVHDTALEGHANQVALEDEKTVLIGESDEDIARYISGIDPEIIGISILFSNLSKHAHRIAGIAKRTNPNIKVVLGGNHITNSAADYVYSMSRENEDLKFTRVFSDMEDPNVDYAMAGECDFQFALLAKTLLAGDDPKNIPGLIYRAPRGSAMGNEIVVVPRAPGGIDITKLPHPARHLMNMEGYFKIGLFHSTRSGTKRVLNVMASRGCPERCSFCTTPNTWGNRIRWRDPDDVCREIKDGIEKYGIGEVQFEDDSLTANRAYLLKLCSLIKPLKIRWCTPNGTKVNYHLKHQPEIFGKMADSGCYQVSVACESGVQRVLDEIIKKNLKTEEVRPAIMNIKNAGLIAHTFWLVGFPGETRAEMEKTIEAAAESGADSFSLAIMNPLPGTPLYRKVVREKLWWGEDGGIKYSIFRKSLIRADGFCSAEEFQRWVDEKSVYLNSLVEKKDPDRAELIIKLSGNSGIDRKVHQT